MRLSYLALLALVGCAGYPLQSEMIEAKKLGVSPRAMVKGVRFVRQKTNHCGPATLSMALSWAGTDLSQDEAAKLVLTPAAQGSYQSDMLSAARRKGLMAIEVSGLDNLIRELDGQRPVIVFQNLGFGWFELWHYSLVTGYDLGDRVFFLNSGAEENQRLSFEQFERGWMRGGYWGMLALPPGALSVSAGLEDHLRAAAMLEKLGHEGEASLAYRQILGRWPDSHWAWFALGNLAYKKNELKAAKLSFERSALLKPDFPYVWHNYAIVLKELGDAKGARAASEKAFAYSSGEVLNKN